MVTWCKLTFRRTKKKANICSVQRCVHIAIEPGIKLILHHWLYLPCFLIIDLYKPVSSHNEYEEWAHEISRLSMWILLLGLVCHGIRQGYYGFSWHRFPNIKWPTSSTISHEFHFSKCCSYMLMVELELRWNQWSHGYITYILLKLKII